MSRTVTVTDSIIRLQSIRGSLATQLEHINQELKTPLTATVNRLFGLHDDYEQMRDQLQESLDATDMRISELQAEQAYLEQLSYSRSAEGLSKFIHNQQEGGDAYGCTLYAQASALESMGYDFNQELSEGKSLGLEQGWFNPKSGSKPQGIGALFKDNGLEPEIYRSRPDPTLDPILAAQHAEDNAFNHLANALENGDYAIVNITGGRLGTGTDLDGVAHTYSSAFGGHSIWVTEIEYDAAGEPISVIANDSWWGETMKYDVDNFMDAWEDHYDYNAAFVSPLKQGGE